MPTHRKVGKMNECIEWTGYCDPYGYGKIHRDHRTQLVHRYHWEKVNGPIPDGLHVLHKCDNPPCYNLEHLYLGNDLDNAKDRAERGRHHSSKKTHCPQGHEYSGSNLYISPNGKRSCRLCGRDKMRRRRANK